MLDYLKSKRGKAPAPPVATQNDDEPILTLEDEEFLRRLTTENANPASVELPPTPPPRPQDLPEAGQPTGNDKQVALLGSDLGDLGDQSSTSYFRAEPPGETGKSIGPESESQVKGKDKSTKSRWSWMRRDSRNAKGKATAKDPKDATQLNEPIDVPADQENDGSDPEAKREQDEMAEALENLNLAAVDNRVFSFSKETRELLNKFTLVLKDLINGVPTAYGDLESLLTNSDDQLQRSYKHLPSWLQKLVQQLPSKMSKTITPEILAAAAEKHGVKSRYADMAAKGAGKAGLKVKVPSLKDLVTKPGAVAGMLKAIMNFLKLRFPAFLGLNVLYSLALFVLLLIFWYCHKRGREVRLEKERLATEEDIKSLGGDTASVSSSTSIQHSSSDDERHPASK